MGFPGSQLVGSAEGQGGLSWWWLCQQSAPAAGHQHRQSCGQAPGGGGRMQPIRSPSQPIACPSGHCRSTRLLVPENAYANRHKFQIILLSVKLSNNEYKSPVLSLALLLLRDVYDIPVMCYSSVPV